MVFVIIIITAIISFCWCFSPTSCFLWVQSCKFKNWCF